MVMELNAKSMLADGLRKIWRSPLKIACAIEVLLSKDDREITTRRICVAVKRLFHARYAMGEKI